ncbi:MAG: SUMF1/EgtB/PvdO family nonheme iron enzyme [Thiotrichaceae bacterium]|nr:SUMF1/EgtB/PvdO family nonheme iron enzyme [Thiotrichaceae bacterium]
MNFLRYILMMFLLLLGFESQAARYALVMGNADYRSMASLHNPAADAEDMATVLGNLKFQVTPLINASKREMDETLGNFYEQVKQQNAAHEVIVYFSGHGLQHEGANHLIPIDASLKQRADIPYMTVNAQQILDNLHEINSTGVNLLILDACRNVPTQLKSLVKGGNEGLVGMKPSGSLVLYATTPGKTALGHGEWRNSIYTHYLLEALRDRTKQSLSIFDVQTVVAAAVSKKTQQQQFPWHEGTLTQAFCFLPPCGVPQKDENLLSEMARLRAENALLKSEKERVVTPVTTEVEQVSSQPPTVNKPPKVSRQAFEPEMVLIPAGTFQMGSNDGDYNYETPVHAWKMNAFYMSKYEVTVGQFKAFVQEMGYTGVNIDSYGCDGLMKPQGFTPADNHPVSCVHWKDAEAYAAWLRKKTGKEYRLPTEAEWEYAARAGTTTKWYFGNDESRLGEYAWYGANSGNKTHVVGQKKPNNFGLYDMAGNVFEWTCSEYASYEDGKDAKCATGKDSRLWRGGSWYSVANDCRSAHRGGDYHGYDGYGFRLVFSAT